MKPLRAGVIGTGFGQLVHMPAYRLHPAFELVAVAAVRPGRAEAVGAAFDVPGYADWRRMLDEANLDVVSVVSEPLRHHEMARYALERGVHVLLEKPMAMNVGEAEDILRLQEERGLVGLINHEFRWFPARREVRRWLREGRLGTVLSVLVTAPGRGPRALAATPVGWLGRREHGGGMLGAVGSHLVDTLLWWLGPIASVSGELVTEMADRPGGPASADDGFSGLLRFASGATGTMVFRQAAPASAGLVMEVNGTAGALRLVGDDELWYCGPDGRHWERVALADWDLPVAVPADSYRTVPAQLKVLDGLAVLLREGSPADWSQDPRLDALVSFRDGLAVQRVLDAWRFSHASGMRWRP